MNKQISQFMGFQHPDKTEMNTLWLEILSSMLNGMNSYFKLKPENYQSFSEYIHANMYLDTENAYFWKWLNDNGIDYLKKTDRGLPNTEDLSDFLKYREMLLEMDIESGIVENFILSVTELFKLSADFIDSYLETGATELSNPSDYKDVRVPMTMLSHTNINELEENWKVFESPAKIQAGLLVYI